MIEIRHRNERGHATYSWLDTHHTFWFDTYHDERYTNFRPETAPRSVRRLY